MTLFPVMFRSILALMLLAVFAHAEPIDAKNPPEGLFADDWAEIYMAGGKVGYMHSTMTREGDRIRTAAKMKLKIGRAAQNVAISTLQATTETVDGRPLAFASDMDASVMKTSMRGEIAEGTVKITSAQFGMEQTQTFDFPSGAIMTWGMFRETLLRGFTPGTSYTLKTYTPDFRLDGPVDAVTKVGEWETFTHAGKERKGQRVSVTMQSPVGAMEMITWVDRDGTMLKGKVPAPGIGDLEIVTTDEAAALTDFVPPELFMATVIRAGRTLHPPATKRITYRLRPSRPDVELGELPSTGMQRVTKSDGDGVVLVVERQSHEPRSPSADASSGHEPQAVVAADRVGQTPARDDATGALSEYLDSNLMMNTRDPELIALAQRAAGGEKEPFALGDRLRRFVTDYVETKSLNIGFATASEVCRTKEGDCSEHGVLLAALGRINGLPSRVAVGLAYVPRFGGQSDIFGYHLWTQFYIDGRWVDFDAALRESDCSPTRIAFATSSLKNTGLADLSLPLISKIGAIDLSIVEVEEKPKPKG